MFELLNSSLLNKKKPPLYGLKSKYVWTKLLYFGFLYFNIFKFLVSYMIIISKYIWFLYSLQFISQYTLVTMMLIRAQYASTVKLYIIDYDKKQYKPKIILLYTLWKQLSNHN